MQLSKANTNVWRAMFLAYLFYHPLDEWFTIIVSNLTGLSGVLTMFLISFLSTLCDILWSTSTITFFSGVPRRSSYKTVVWEQLCGEVNSLGDGEPESCHVLPMKGDFLLYVHPRLC